MRSVLSLGVAIVASACAAIAYGCGGGTTREALKPGDAGPDVLFAESDAGLRCSSSPTNFEIPGNNCDDDGDGQVDNVAVCDDSLLIDGPAEDFARALGICQRSQGNTWGLLSATYTGSYGSSAPPNDLQHGILHKFGDLIKPQEGQSLGVLSSGYAREFNGPSGNGPFQQGETMSGPGKTAPGFPRPAAGCEISDAVNDVVTVKLKIRVPTNAKGIAFDFNFFSGEWPEWVCTKFNDGFAAILTSHAYDDGTPDNISFDAQKNPVSVNNAFFDRCTPGTPTGCAGVPPASKVSACAGGESELTGTGFFQHGLYCSDKDSTGGGATGWLTSSAPVQPGEDLTLEFLIWDTGDARYDSSVLLDHLRWQAGDTTTVTARPK